MRQTNDGTELNKPFEYVWVAVVRVTLHSVKSHGEVFIHERIRKQTQYHLCSIPSIINNVRPLTRKVLQWYGQSIQLLLLPLFLHCYCFLCNESQTRKERMLERMPEGGL